jgi:hypothetical protein
MCINFRIKNILVNSIVLGSMGLVLALDAQADCPPRFQARIDAMTPRPPAGWENVSWELPRNDTSGAELVSISNDQSIVKTSEELQRFQREYRVDPLNLDPKLEAKRKFHNAMELHATYRGKAQQACDAIDGINKRILELQAEANQAFEDYKHDEWIDFASNSLSVSGNVILYVTGVGEVAQLGKAALKLKKLKDRVRNYELYQLMAQFGNFPQRSVAQFMATVPGRLSRLYMNMTRFENALSMQAWRTALSLTIRTIPAPLQGAIDGARGTLPETVTEFLLGGDVWKQFQGFLNPYEEMIQLNLDMKKKWVGDFNSSAGQAMSEKGRIESLMSQIVSEDEAARRSPPQGIGYGGFSITRPVQP